MHLETERIVSVLQNRESLRTGFLLTSILCINPCGPVRKIELDQMNLPRGKRQRATTIKDFVHFVWASHHDLWPSSVSWYRP